ncbi:hypothetical protein PVK06_012191 [Gossypium arboreum]|uniref:Uncharacterized protein n=1 Tax=Gossypium arboreum TaxID=29729 RepID=A0ABR0QBM4_GOSAR|nr:hypothetical protein PVK06_012191 [Gossypium arboreum]
MEEEEVLEELRINIEMQQVRNLRVAMNMARALERKQTVSSKMSSRTNLDWPTSQSIGNNSIILMIRALQKEGAKPTKPMGNNSKICSSMPFIKRLTQAEMAEKMAKGLCYNCDESYSMGHKCKRLDDECEQDEDEVDDLEISLHAISGTCNSSIMQLKEKVSRITMLVLVNTDSMQNFLHEGLMPK